MEAGGSKVKAIVKKNAKQNTKQNLTGGMLV